MSEGARVGDSQKLVVQIRFAEGLCIVCCMQFADVVAVAQEFGAPATSHSG